MHEKPKLTGATLEEELRKAQRGLDSQPRERWAEIVAQIEARARQRNDQEMLQLIAVWRLRQQL